MVARREIGLSKTPDDLRVLTQTKVSCCGRRRYPHLYGIVRFLDRLYLAVAYVVESEYAIQAVRDRRHIGVCLELRFVRDT